MPSILRSEPTASSTGLGDAESTSGDDDQSTDGNNPDGNNNKTNGTDIDTSLRREQAPAAAATAAGDGEGVAVKLAQEEGPSSSSGAEKLGIREAPAGLSSGEGSANGAGVEDGGMR